MRKTALITGITGQDGSYLAELLLEKDYNVHGIVRRSSLPNTGRLDGMTFRGNPLGGCGKNVVNRREPTGEGVDDNGQKQVSLSGRNLLPVFGGEGETDTDRLTLHVGDMTDSSSLIRILETVEPDEVYHLAAQSHVRLSFELPEYTGDVNALGTVRLLEAIRLLGMTEKVRLYQASTSELFGKVSETPQNELTPFAPRSPYAAAKLYAYWAVRNYREAYGLFAVNGILFNHESPRRGENFVTRKVSRGAARFRLGLDGPLQVGNLDAVRDWGHAADYVQGMWLMLQQEKPDDFVLATGEVHTVRELIERAFAKVGYMIGWRGEGLAEEGFDRGNGRVVAQIDPRFFRPTEVETLCGDAGKAKRELGWVPRYSFAELVDEMVEYDLRQAASWMAAQKEQHKQS